MMVHSGWRTGNKLTLLRNGAEFFPALLFAIETAQFEIRLETYIFEADEVGLNIANALMHAAQRGVNVGLLIDGFGAKNFPADLRQRLQTAGVYFLFFRPEVSPFSVKKTRLRRLHRKLSCFDGRVAFVGGINILSDDDGEGLAPRYDYAVQVEGPVVSDIQQALARQWRYTSWVQLKKQLFKSFLRVQPPVVGDSLARLLVRDNARNRRTIEKSYIDAIQAASSEVLIANAYFLPGRRMRQALIKAAKRGVNVVLLLQDERDHALLQYASWAFYRQFLDAGIDIFQYKSGFMHAKVAVIDGQWATVGSSNIDPFSLLLAREADLVVQDESFAKQLRYDIRLHLQQDATQVVPEHIKNAGFALRWLVWACYGLVRLLLGITGYGGRKYLE
ncbi:cardiolipin synthase ClsB [Deefgea tanakiae]|uniref:Cardiolipin synthase B n=2 Tax=Deefgea tanakiae TaxID=2865840 RepID=A0ABX8Z8T3_9NEIS|nr:cardiolipin synthase ClsB [Deefgea tanakiae]